MALWLVRAGKYGEYERHFFETNRVYATWSRLRTDLSRLQDQPAIRTVLQQVNPDASEKKAINHASQLWAFAHTMRAGDWVVTPLKNKPAIAFGEVLGTYEFSEKAEDPYYHSRSVKWFAPEVLRSIFDQDLLYSFGAFMTICEISRNDAESRVRALASSGWKQGKTVTVTAQGANTAPDVDAASDLEPLARDQIAKFLIRTFKGHGMERLVEALLRAQGYSTYRSPEGADKGIDIVAAPGPLGFGHPRLCVQVKSEEKPIEHAVLTQLIGAMQAVQADQGLLVSWGGFKQSIDRDRAMHFFKVRLWDQDDLIDALLEHYETLSADFRAEIPLKRLWTIATSVEDD